MAAAATAPAATAAVEQGAAVAMAVAAACMAATVCIRAPLPVLGWVQGSMVLVVTAAAASSKALVDGAQPATAMGLVALMTVQMVSVLLLWSEKGGGPC